jgi:glycosyltransferase involved in cell wall biosynthesis
MLQLPKTLQNVHKFRDGDRMYVTDVVQCKVLEIDAITWDILELCASFTSDEIIDKLSEKYNQEEVTEALESLAEVEQNGLLFSQLDKQISTTTVAAHRLRILVAQGGPYVDDLTLVAGGVRIAHTHLIKALLPYADVEVMNDVDKLFDDGVQGIAFRPEDRSSLLKLIQRKYDGVLLQKHTDTSFIPLLRYIDAPFVVPIYSLRGHNGESINSVLRWYSRMRAFDAFLTPTESVKDFYLSFASDTSAFETILLGVDLDHFKPMEKHTAKAEVARILNKPELVDLPIVGYLSRFQPEKGAGIYIKIAELLPDVCFLVTAPTLNFYEHQRFPPNLIYLSQQPRDRLPYIFNAFDVYCLPSMVGEETFGLAVLEAMACGIPPVVPRLDGLPEVVGDAGVIVPASEYRDEIGSFAGTVCPFAMSDAIDALLKDKEKRLKLGEKAAQRARDFTWDATARHLLTLLEKQAKIQRLATRHRREFPISFAPYLDENQRGVGYKAILSNVTNLKERPFMLDGYVQTVEEGLALSLLNKGHSVHEVEAVLQHFCDETKAESVIEKVLGFQEATS